MGKTKPERSSESVAKATTRMAKKLVCIIFFLMRFFLKHVLKLGATVDFSIWGRQNQKEAPKVLQKLLKAWQKKLLCIFLRVFLKQVLKLAQIFTSEYGEDKTRKKPRKCCKSH